MSRRPSRTRKAAKKVKEAPQDLSKAIDELCWIVPDEEHKLRIDRFLGERLPWRSRTSILALLAEGQVTVEGEEVEKKSHKLKAGQRVAVVVPPPEEPERHAELAAELEGAILYEDEDLIALNKPPGLVVHPVGRIRVNTLIQALHWRFRHGARAGEEVPGGSRPGQVGPVIPRICHRLDRDTSGVLVVAKNAQARTRMQSVIESSAVEKVYLACVHGTPEPPEGRIELAIGPDQDGAKDLMMTTRSDGSPSLTSYALEEQTGALSWVRFRIHTGRQHQIRVHARAIGHPVLCDLLYGRGEACWPPEEPRIARQALHAYRMAFPFLRGALEFEAPLAPDLSALREHLRGRAAPGKD